MNLKLRPAKRLRCPPELTGQERVVWRHLVRLVGQLCDLHPCDQFVLMRYVFYFSRWVAGDRDRWLLRTMRRIEGDFGMTLHTRRRLLALIHEATA